MADHNLPEEVQDFQFEEPIYRDSQAEIEALRNMITEADEALSNALPEAPIVFWGNLYSPKTGAQYSLTIRGHNPEQVIRKYSDAVRFAHQHLGLSPDPNAFRKHTREQQQVIASDVPENEPVNAAPQMPASAVSRESTTVPKPATELKPGDVIEYPLYKIIVEPLKDDKAKVGFVPILTNGQPGQFPTCYEQRFTAQEWSNLFAAFFPIPVEGFRGFKQEHIVPGLRFVAVVSERVNNKGRFFIDFDHLEKVL